MADEQSLVIGVDLGGTNIVGAVVSAAGSVVHETRRATEAAVGGERVIENIIAVVKQILADRADLSLRVKAIGVGTPGCVDADRGVVVSQAYNIPGWRGMNIKQRLESAVDIPTWADNDVNVTALGEYRFGAGRGVQDLICITIGTGIGGGIVIGGRVHHGIGHNAGELGHTTIDMNGRVCACGSIGCLEAYAAAPAIAREGRRLLASGAATCLGELVSDPERVEAADVAKAAQEGDAAALGIFEQTGRCIGAAMSNFINALNPEMIVIGGGVAQAGDVLFEPIRREIKLRALDVCTAMLRVEPAQLGDRAGVIGSAALALQHVNL